MHDNISQHLWKLPRPLWRKRRAKSLAPQEQLRAQQSWPKKGNRAPDIVIQESLAAGPRWARAGRTEPRWVKRLGEKVANEGLPGHPNLVFLTIIYYLSFFSFSFGECEWWKARMVSVRDINTNGKMFVLSAFFFLSEVLALQNFPHNKLDTLSW